MRLPCVYILKKNTPFVPIEYYVGQTTNYEKRMKSHSIQKPDFNPVFYYTTYFPLRVEKAVHRKFKAKKSICEGSLKDIKRYIESESEKMKDKYWKGHFHQKIKVSIRRDKNTTFGDYGNLILIPKDFSLHFEHLSEGHKEDKKHEYYSSVYIETAFSSLVKRQILKNVNLLRKNGVRTDIEDMKEIIVKTNKLMTKYITQELHEEKQGVIYANYD